MRHPGIESFTEVLRGLGGGLGILKDVESQRVDGGMPTPRSFSFRWGFLGVKRMLLAEGMWDV